MSSGSSKEYCVRPKDHGRRSKVISLAHLIPYESFNGAFLGQSFRIQCLVSVESCYDLYAVEPLFATSHTYEARGYTFQGLKNKERNHRMRHLKRCSGNRFFKQSLDQGGKKWVILECATTSKYEESVPLPSSDVLTGHMEPSLTPDQRAMQTRASPSKISRSEQVDRLEQVRELTALGSPPSPSIRDRKAPVLAMSHREGDTRAPQSKKSARKSPAQLERRRERQRHGRQVRKMLKTKEQNLESTPRVFMQWEYREVRRLLYKQSLNFEAKLQRQSALLLQRERQHDQDVKAILRTFQRASSLKQEISQPIARHYRTALHLIDQMDDDVVSALMSLLGSGALNVPTNLDSPGKSDRHNTHHPELGRFGRV